MNIAGLAAAPYPVLSPCQVSGGPMFQPFINSASMAHSAATTGASFAFKFSCLDRSPAASLISTKHSISVPGPIERLQVSAVSRLAWTPQFRARVRVAPVPVSSPHARQSHKSTTAQKSVKQVERCATVNEPLASV